MTARWPATLTDRFLAAGWSEGERPHFDADVTESGRDIRSKKPGSPLTDITVAFNGDRADKAELKAFHRVDCARGALPFEAPDPDGDDLRVFWWSLPPKFTARPGAGKKRYRITLSLAREE